MTVASEKVAVKLVRTAATITNNYWSPLACLVKEQEEASEIEETGKTSVDLAMAATSVIGSTNKAAAHWAQKIYNRKLRKTGILDTGATSGAAPEEEEDSSEQTRQ